MRTQSQFSIHANGACVAPPHPVTRKPRVSGTPTPGLDFASRLPRAYALGYRCSAPAALGTRCATHWCEPIDHSDGAAEAVPFQKQTPQSKEDTQPLNSD